MKRVIFRKRGRGKTFELLEWAKQGVKTNSYPFWDRVILTITLNEAQQLRKQLVHEMNDPDAYNLVYSCVEWATARLGSRSVMVAFDNADIYLRALFGDVQIITVSKE